MRGDAYVKDFEIFLTFKRDNQKWLLDSIEEGFKDFVEKENIDEGTSKKMMEWFYSKERTV